MPLALTFICAVSCSRTVDPSVLVRWKVPVNVAVSFRRLPLSPSQMVNVPL